MYYGLILLSVVIFGGCFGLDDMYQRRRGTSLRISLEYSLLSALAGLIVLSVINGFRIQVLVDIPWSDFKSATVNSMHHTNGITGTVFSLLPVWIAKNTGPTGYTAFQEDDTEHVIRTAPFYVYDAIVPLKDGVQ